MNISRTFSNGVVTLKPEGWLDAISSPELGAEVDAVTDATEIVLDLDLVEYIASSGVRQLVAAHKKAESIGAKLSIINVGTEVMSILGLTGIDKKLAVKAK